jgi:wyosine [tRNA(Phe)-imidazoG37] synthetase (radical SAM superfamily)
MGMGEPLMYNNMMKAIEMIIRRSRNVPEVMVTVGKNEDEKLAEDVKE